MPRHDYRRLFHTQTYDRTSKIPWKLYRQTHFFCYKNQIPLGKSYVECWGVLTSWIQTYTNLRFNLWALTRTTNIEGKINSSFRVPYWIQGLWQYLKTLLAQSSWGSSPKVEPSKKWLMEVKRSSKAIRILSPYTTIPCSFRGTTIEALHNSMVETNIMFKFLAEALLGKMPLVSTNKLFKSPSGLIF